MRKFPFILTLAASLMMSIAGGFAQGKGLALPKIYESWRSAMVRKDYQAWKSLTAMHRRIDMRNQIVSQKQPFPQALFNIPTAPPSVKNLKLIKATANGRTAKAVWFGPVDFGVGGKPTDNLYVVSFVQDGPKWLYDGAEFVSLDGLKDVRKQLRSGDKSYLNSPDFTAPGVVPPLPQAVKKVDNVAKVYAFCPGRAVDVTINGMSQHRIQNAQEAQFVIGGAKNGVNSISFKTRTLEGGKGKEAFTVRVYLMSPQAGKKPVKVYEYLVNEGGAVQGAVKAQFQVTKDMASRL